MTEQPLETGSQSNSRKSKLPEIPADRYTVISELGQGGMGVVLKARHAKLNKLVAIKVLNASMLADEAGVKRFEVEAKAGSQLTHPNLVSVFDYGFTEDREPYLVMEYIEGESLDDFLDRLETLDKSTFINVFEQVVKGLQYVHNHDIIHRDLKTSNIMIEQIDGDLYAKLLDFGVAKVLADSGVTMHNLTETGAAFGSPLYMSPEQCMGLEVDPRSDIYSLGCVMYQCVVGLPPIIGANPLQTIHMQVNSDEPELIKCDAADSAMKRIALLIQKCLKKTAEERYQNTHDLLTEILSIKEEMEAERYQSIPPSKAVRVQSDESVNVEKTDPEIQSALANLNIGKNTLGSNPWTKSTQTNPKQESSLNEEEVMNPNDAEDGITARDIELRQITTQSLRQKDIAPPERESSNIPSIIQKIVVLAAVVVVGACAVIFVPKIIDNQSNSFEKAEASFKNGKWSTAEEIYERLLERDATNNNTGIIHVRLAQIQQEERPGEAISNFRKALKLLDEENIEQAPFVAKSLVGLAFIYMDRKEFDEVPKLLEKASKIASGQKDFELMGDIKLGQAMCSIANNTDSHDVVDLFNKAINEYSKLSNPPARKLAEALLESAEYCHKNKLETEVVLRAKDAIKAAQKIKVAHDREEIIRRANNFAALEKKVIPAPQIQKASTPPTPEIENSKLKQAVMDQNNAVTQAQLDAAKRQLKLTKEFSDFRAKQMKKTSKMLKDMSKKAYSVKQYGEDTESIDSLKKFSEDFVQH